MRTLILTLVFAALAAAGCQTHMHAGGGRGFDAGASLGPDRTHTYYPPVVIDTPPR